MSRLLARGFKASAERLAAAVRAELGLTCLDRLDPAELARHLDVPVQRLSDLHDVTVEDDRRPAERGGLDGVSAFTVTDGQHHVVVVNDTHARTRQASSLAHELAHVLLDHPARPLAGARRWEPELEQEADWLGGALLVPEEGARVLAIRGASAHDVARRYGVSRQLARWRLDASGARRVARNVHAKRRRQHRRRPPSGRDTESPA